MRPSRRKPKKAGSPRRRAAAVTLRDAAAGDRPLQMHDIAQMAGVSTSTVSRALNQSALVNEETRQRIERLAQSLNYSINVGARNLRLQQNRTVAVIVPFESTARQHVSDPFFVSMLGCLADALTDRGYDMLLSRIDAAQLERAGELAASGRALGVILIGQWHQHEQLNALASRRTPIVVWGAQLPQQYYCTVGSDNIAGGALATEHLIARGRRRIAFLGDVGLPEVAHRFEGYQAALARANLPADAGLVQPAAFVEGSARRAIDDLLQRNSGFDALFACSDLMAMEAISTLQDRGMRVPQDVAVVGFDDIALARYFRPTLTTVRQAISRGADCLVNALLAIVAGEKPAAQVLPTELIVRESSGG